MIPHKNLISLILIDGAYRFKFLEPYVQETIPPITTVVKGDEKLFTMACASIMAKVSRDRMLRKASSKYIGYGLHKNKGYATKEHLQAIRKLGISRLHRKNFLKNKELNH